MLPLSWSTRLVAAVQKGSASTVAKVLIAEVESRAFCMSQNLVVSERNDTL
jgi:hypothetical protein